MSGFLIFATGDRLPECDGLRGLQAEGDIPLSRMPLECAGPSGTAGSLWYFDDAQRPGSTPHLVYRPESQVWKKGPDGEWWIGWTKDHPPTATDLQRGDRIRFGGFGLKLNDQQRWYVPNAMMLPQEFDYDDNGCLTMVTKGEFQSLYERTLWALQFATDQLPLQDRITADNRAEVIQYCGEMLGLNYRLTPAIAVRLKLFDPGTLWNCLCMTTDVEKINQLIDELEKKGSVETGDSPDTDSGKSG